MSKLKKNYTNCENWIFYKTSISILDLTLKKKQIGFIKSNIKHQFWKKND